MVLALQPPVSHLEIQLPYSVHTGLGAGDVRLLAYPRAHPAVRTEHLLETLTPAHPQMAALGAFRSRGFAAPSTGLGGLLFLTRLLLCLAHNCDRLSDCFCAAIWSKDAAAAARLRFLLGAQEGFALDVLSDLEESVTWPWSSLV